MDKTFSSWEALIKEEEELVWALITLILTLSSINNFQNKWEVNSPITNVHEE